MTESQRQLAIRALENFKGDDLARARAARKNLPGDTRWGESGATLDEIVSQYEERDRAADAAIAALKNTV